ncbi:hypothetical protein C0J52_25465 [Blattella germanica]|nr:hypothetical protein C0J52_25465 [Blattella germanica]
MKRYQMKIALLLLVAFTVAISEGLEVEQRSLDINGVKKTYFLVKDRRTWNESQSACEELDGNLLVINSVEEASEIRNEPLEDTGFYYWGFHQPDDYNGSEDCGAFRKDGFLADVSCEESWDFFCESG